MTITEKITRAKSDYDAVYEAGKKAEYDEFWKNFFTSNPAYASIVDGVAVVNGEYLFSGKGWDDDTFKPPYPIRVTYGYGMFYSTGISDAVIDIDFSRATYMTMTFSQALIKHVKTVDLSNSASTNRIFFYNRMIETIDRIVFAEKNPSYEQCFTMCGNLKNITADGVISKSISFSDSPLLTKASITSIVNTLSSTTSGLALTLSQTAVNNAFTTDEWEALIATKSNWSISLV